MKKIAVAGAGYVGLSLAVLLARQNEVVAVDVVKEKVGSINKGVSPIKDVEIQEYLSSDLLNLRATTDGRAAYGEADVVIVATPTNYDDVTNEFDTQYVEQVIDLVLEVNPDALIVVKSTIPVGYTDEITERYPGAKFLFSPEFLREGRALYDNLHPSRIIVGVPAACADDEERLQLARDFADLLKRAAIDLEVHVRIMSAKEAEAVKLFANTYLAVRVAFFNELDTYAETQGLSSRRIIEGVTLDPRIGDHYCNPSFGYGGYCLPKDTKQLLANYEGIPQDMIGAVVRANVTRKRYIAERVAALLESKGKKAKEAMVGAYRLTMKSGSDNYRASAIQGVMDNLRELGIKVVVFEPTYGEASFNGFEVVADFDSFVNGCDMVLANRMDDRLRSVGEKVYTRDFFYRD